MGWYHSHPFDVGSNPQWFSRPDCQNQVAWQRQEDMHGNPWLGLVVDPLRTIAKGKPSIGAFRCFMPAYSLPTDMTPDGSVVTAATKSAAVERWGNCYNRYYSLDIEYFMAEVTRQMVSILMKNFMWRAVLSSSLVSEPEYMSCWGQNKVDWR